MRETATPSLGGAEACGARSDSLDGAVCSRPVAGTVRRTAETRISSWRSMRLLNLKYPKLKLSLI